MSSTLRFRLPVLLLISMQSVNAPGNGKDDGHSVHSDKVSLLLAFSDGQMSTYLSAEENHDPNLNWRSATILESSESGATHLFQSDATATSAKSAENLMKSSTEASDVHRGVIVSCSLPGCPSRAVSVNQRLIADVSCSLFQFRDGLTIKLPLIDIDVSSTPCSQSVSRFIQSTLRGNEWPFSSKMTPGCCTLNVLTVEQEMAANTEKSCRQHIMYRLCLFSTNTVVFLHVHFTALLHNSTAHCPGLVKANANRLSLSQSPPNDDTFCDMPFWSKLFIFNHRDHNTCNKHQSFAILDHSVVTFIYSVIILMAIIDRCLPRSTLGQKGKDGNNLYLTFLTYSIFLKWQWTQPQSKVNTSHCFKRQKTTRDSSEHSALLRKLSKVNVFHDCVRRPWSLKHENTKSDPPEHCLSSNYDLLDTMTRSAKDGCLHRTFHVKPCITSFLPDATLNPTLDLAHLGYRLATLSALPPAVPVSRVRLADAGFYFRGQGDEVTCYSCQLSHAGWTREDNPMEVHRRLSPHCEHVLQRDGELATLASHATGCQGTASNGPGVATAGTDSNMPVEDGDSFHAARLATQSRPTPRVARPSSDRPLSSTTGSPAVHTGLRPADTGAGGAERPGNTTHRTQGHARSSHLTGLTSSVNNLPQSQAHSNSSAMSTTTSSSIGHSAHNTSTSSSASCGGHGNAEPRLLFPRAGLELGGAVYPFHQDMASRRRTFTSWDDSQAPPLDQVLLCGMFYAGYADCVRCFYCGVGLKHWVATDDVWTEHVRWRPDCGYLRAVKGDNFIRGTLRRLGAEGQGENQNGVLPPDRSNNSQSHLPQGQRPIAPAPASVPNSNVTTATTTAYPALVTQASVTASATAPSTSHGSTGSEATLSAAATTSTPPPSNNNQATAGERAEGGASLTAAASAAAAEDVEQLARLQEENRMLSRRLQCRVCQRATIDTILMPCGHLLVCQACATTITTCPLCGDTVRATARVHFD